MKEEKTYKDILENPSLKQNPYSVPEGYFAELEDKVRAAVNPEYVEAPKGLALFKPALVLAVMFAVVGGLGLGVAKITEKMYNPVREVEDEGIYALIEEGYIEPDFMYRYYDEFDLDEALTVGGEDRITAEDIEEYIINSMTVEEVYYHINKDKE